jgi:hypothetical protein
MPQLRMIPDRLSDWRSVNGFFSSRTTPLSERSAGLPVAYHRRQRHAGLAQAGQRFARRGAAGALREPIVGQFEAVMRGFRTFSAGASWPVPIRVQVPSTPGPWGSSMPGFRLTQTAWTNSSG